MHLPQPSLPVVASAGVLIAAVPAIAATVASETAASRGRNRPRTRGFEALMVITV